MALPKLDNDQRMFALRMHAEGHSYHEISREIKTKYDITINDNAINDTCNAIKWQPYVEHFKKEYLAHVKSVPIANKRVRIDDLDRERKRINKLIEQCPTKTKADKSAYVNLVGELRRLIVEAREEMEKKPHLFQNVNVMGMGDMTDEGLHQRKQALIAKYRRADGAGASGAESDSGGTESEDT